MNLDSKTLMLPGGISLEILYCPPGRFIMGSDESEPGRDTDEQRHAVQIGNGFWLGKFPVTQKQWMCVMGRNPSRIVGDDLPVVNVSYDECIAFTKRAEKSAGVGMRLPTEPEWEYACRAGTKTAYAWGDGADGKISGRQLLPVSQCYVNALGFFGMHGNVFEWCCDWYDANYGLQTGAGKRFDSERYKVVRGGSWASEARDCRSAFRSREYPDFKSHEIGFRICCDNV